MLFYLGTHMPNWLGMPEMPPLFVSRRRLARQKAMPRAQVRWALDSGGFSELSIHGRWETTPAQYGRAVRLYQDQIGMMDWAAIQDWMCEPFMLEKTGLTMAEHQARTIRSLLELRDSFPEVRWLPVLQGWEEPDYLRHVDQYSRAGVDLGAEPLVGLGSVCRRQATAEAAQIVERLHAEGLSLHCFGFKIKGLGKVARLVSSADSMAWSYNARRHPPLPGHTHKSCASCPDWAIQWHGKVMAAIGEDRGMAFDQKDVRAEKKVVGPWNRCTLTHRPTGTQVTCRTRARATSIEQTSVYARALRDLELAVLAAAGEELPLRAEGRYALREMQATGRPLVTDATRWQWAIPSGTLAQVTNVCYRQDVQDLAAAGLIMVRNGRRAILTDRGRGWKA